MTTAPAHYEVDTEFLAAVQRCYKPHCRYLRSATVVAESDTIVGRGRFAVPEPCYIDDTGHLNAVEVIICYNQLMYQTLGMIVRHGLAPEFGEWTSEDFLRRYLPDVLIAEVNTRFERPIDATGFSGEFLIDGMRRYRPGPDRAPRIALETSFRFGDDRGGQCAGDIRLVVVDSGERR
ncbi:FcoT family thioesterase [Nocardia terpenica]|uniref:(2E)-enoyl-[ACP] glycyltransferase n=1 Tax=Nocardia terpenica TaxID=455432 RepID=A0A291RLQ6_9NOCA|nr:FcoT family thioesterase [Nocardia terpenica]ATL68307.1 hypothetical protein CRH09_21100 [Nocardia terpenica]